MIKSLDKNFDLKYMHTMCTQYLGACTFFLGACTRFSDDENPTFSAEFYKLPPNYSYRDLFHPQPFWIETLMFCFQWFCWFGKVCIVCKVCTQSV